MIFKNVHRYKEKWKAYLFRRRLRNDNFCFQFYLKTNNLVIKLSQTIALVESVPKPKEDIA